MLSQRYIQDVIHQYIQDDSQQYIQHEKYQAELHYYQSFSNIIALSVLTEARCWWRSWLRHCATSRKVAGSIPDGVIGIYHGHNPSDRTMTLGSTQPLTEMSTRNISWGSKGGWLVGLTTLSPSCADCLQIWEPHPPGTFRACPGL